MGDLGAAGVVGAAATDGEGPSVEMDSCGWSAKLGLLRMGRFDEETVLAVMKLSPIVLGLLGDCTDGKSVL